MRSRRRKAHTGQFVPQALLGAFVGIVPVVIGMLFYPAMRGFGRQGLNFVLALTVGLLVFLVVDFDEGSVGARRARPPPRSRVS